MEDQRDDPSSKPRTDGRVVVALVGAAVLALVGYFALGMPGMDHGGGVEHTEHEVEQAP